MKKRLVCGLVYLLFLGGQLVYANDGSLQIDANLTTTAEKSEISYIEQESDLAKLFQSETEKSISEMQEEAEQSYRLDKEGLFLHDIQTDSVIETYQPLLFTSKTMVHRNDNYGVSLTEKKTGLSIQMLLIIILGMTVTLYSVFRNKLKGKQ
ncbi:type VII secretion EssA family protein [Streptococcus parasuis]|uniref:type VII secretion EssA family protein n=1 Tax=Streptococcus parasuis TaxID=1501662 RepID=UPI001C1F52E6|nr:type VII secretion EssA family protein [Streptococcus parasuis]QWV86606.1 type VII secretion EssA family protein [Streptococcus parasuis]